jgi:isoquinoline 1-oxidoreductase beta subunit
VHKIDPGGGFGRRGSVHDYITQATQIAMKLPGTPIKLLWSREEDMTHGAFHPVTMCKLTAAIDNKGELDGLHMRIAGQSILTSIVPNALVDGVDYATFQGLLPKNGERLLDHVITYDIDNLLIDHAMRNPHIRPGFWRGVNANQNAIYLECFLDEVAHATGKDALALRRRLLTNNPKALAVLEAVAKQGGWGQGKPADVTASDRFGRGLAVYHCFGSFIAACAEVSVNASGALHMRRIVAATDSGHAVNPKQIAMQVEGSFVYGLGAMLHQHCTVKDGKIEQENFHAYPPLKLAEMPKVETIVMPSGGFWGGVGEPTIAVAAPAVLNAIFQATDKRIRELPLRGADLKA